MLVILLDKRLIERHNADFTEARDRNYLEFVRGRVAFVGDLDSHGEGIVVMKAFMRGELELWRG